MNTNDRSFKLLILDGNLEYINNIIQTIKPNINIIINNDNNILDDISKLNITSIDSIGLIFKDINIEYITNLVLNLNKKYTINFIDFINFRIESIENNINYNNKNNNLFIKYSNIDINYNDSPKIIDYNVLNFSNIPWVGCLDISITGGEYYLIDNIDDVNINKETGQIIFNVNKVGNYNMKICYKISNIEIYKQYNFTVNPVISYNINNININYGEIYNSSLPIIKPNVDNYIFSSDSQIININNNGIFTINNNINPGNYKIKINYTINNLAGFTELIVNINSQIKYNSYNINLDFGDSYQSDIPIIDNKVDNGYFILKNFINNINIDKNTGVIYTSNLNIGTYILLIDYKTDIILYSTSYIINVIPKLVYNSLETLNVGEIGNSVIPLVNNKNNTEYIFEIGSNNFNNKINIDKLSGKLYFNNLSVGIYDILINLKAKNNKILNSFNYKLTVNPIFYYSPTNYSIDYGQKLTINKPYFSEKNGIISCDNLSNGFSINKDGIIIINNNADIGTYTLNIKYIVNDIILINKLIVIINPIIKYNNVNDIKFGISNYICSPYVSHQGGTYSIDYIYGISIDENNGSLTINECYIGVHNLKIKYTLGELYTFTTLELNVLPVINYGDDIEIYYGTNAYSNQPYINPPVAIDSSFIIKGNFIDKSISINNNGKLFFSNLLDVDIYNIDIEYFTNNLRVNTSYFLTVKPYIEYKTLNKTLDYMSGWISEIPIIKTNIKGLFSLNIDNNYISIDSNTGVLTFRDKLECDEYNFNIIYSVNNINTILKYKLIINPIVRYKENSIIINFNSNYLSEKPLVIESDVNNIGSFVIENINGITINHEGIISIDNKLNIGIYYFKVTYIKNKTFTISNFSLIVNPIIEYDLTNTNITFKKSFKSIKPNILPMIYNGYFSISTLTNYINIDSKTGIIYINDKILIGEYELPINYSNNNTNIVYLFKFKVIPQFYYVNNDIIINTTQQLYSELPIVEPSDGIFSIDNSYDNQIINSNNGIVNFSKLPIGQYELIITYKINNISSIFNLKIKVVPTIYYSDTDIKIEYNNLSYSEPIIINQKNDKLYYYLSDEYISNGLRINSDDGVIYFTNFNKIGKFIIPVYFSYNNIIANTTYTIEIIPSIVYTNILEINDISNYESMIIYSDAPKIYVPDQNKGSFYLKDFNLVNIDSKTGILEFDLNKINAGKHKFNVYYKYENYEVFTEFNVIIHLFIKYKMNNITVQYRTNNSSDAPLVNLQNGIFTCDNLPNGIILNKHNGILNFNKILELNNYDLIINYSINNLITSTNLNVHINETINYNPSITNLIYSDIGTSVLPEIYSDNGIYTSTNLPSGVTLDKNTGQLEFNSNIDVGLYNINIIYNHSNFISSCIYTLNIKPSIFYENSLINLDICQFNKNNIIFTSELPILKPLNGIILYDDIPLGITINSLGQIIIMDNIELGSYNLNIKYKVNNVISETTFNINVSPILNYDINYKEIEYNDEYFSDKPNYHPLNGIFKLKNGPIGVSIDNNGIISSNKNVTIGNYNLCISYSKKNMNVNTIFNFIIKPTIRYEYDTFIYNNDTYKSSSPYVNSSNGYFMIDNSSEFVTINKYTGIITIGNLEVGEYNYKISYIVNSVTNYFMYSFKILPNIIYSSNEIIAIHGIKTTTENPIIKPIGGIFSLEQANTNLIINQNYGFIEISENIDIGIYDLVINYIYNNVNIQNNYKIIVKPNINYIPLEIIYGNDTLYKINNTIYNGTFEIINNKYAKIQKNGDVDIINHSIGDFNYTINYTENNFNFNYNFLLIVKPDIKYDSDYVFDFSKDSIIYPNISCYVENGYFEISNGLFDIDNKGIIKFNYIDVGFYYIDVYYYYYDNYIKIPINITILPIINYYDHSFIKFKTKGETRIPNIMPTEGTFTLENNINGIDIDTKFGVMTFNNNVYPDDYNLIVNYTVNNITAKTTYNLKIIPYFEYPIKILELDYGINYESCLPITDPLEGTFYIDNKIEGINIDQHTGKIYISSILDVNTYKLIINFKVNNIITQTNFEICIKSTIASPKYDNILKYGNIYIIDKPIVTPLNGIFSFNLNNPNIILNEQTGEITINNNVDIGNYNIKLNYNINGYNNFINYNFDIIPEIYYDPSSSIINYNEITTSNNPILTYNLNNCTFNLVDNIKNITIDNNGIICFNNNIDVGTYNLNIECFYSSSNIKINTNYLLTVNSIFYYDINYATINYSTNFNSNKPYVSPQGFNFSCNNLSDGIMIDKITGIISVNDQVNIGKYELNIVYNNINQIYTIIVNPTIKYNENDIIINYGTSYVLYPLLNPQSENGYFSAIKENDININEQTGIINIKSNLLSGIYNLKISYSINDLVVYSDILITVNSVIDYTINKNIINYGITTKSVIPNIKPLGGLFYSDNLPENTVINDETGLLEFNNVNVGNYNIDINYKINNKIDRVNYNLIVNPVIYYDDNNNSGFYNIMNKSSKPIVKPENGVFNINIENNNNYNITIDNKTGIIYLDKKLPIDIYNIFVYYTVNQIRSNIIYTFEIKPNIDYKEQIFFFDNNNKLLVPNIAPKLDILENYNFKIINNNNNNITINNKGIISINKYTDIGKYKLEIEFNYNNKSIKTFCVFIIKPIINYKNFKPVINNLNNIRGDFYINDNMKNIIKINQKTGEIIILNKNIACHQFIVKHILNNIITNITLELIIRPDILYNVSNAIIDYGDNYQTDQLEIVNKEINGSNIKINLQNLRMNTTNNIHIQYNGIINFNNFNVGHYIFDIKYQHNLYNKINTSSDFELIVKPIFKYKKNYLEGVHGKKHFSEKPLISPEGGVVKLINNNEKNINYTKDGILFFNHLKPGKYELELVYIYNDISTFTSYTVIIKPIIIYYEDTINIKQGTVYNIMKPELIPNNGILKIKSFINSNHTNDLSSIVDINNLINNNNEIIIPDYIPIDNYYLTVAYIVNNQEATYIFNIIVEPVMYYPISNLTIMYNEEKQSIKPIFYNSDGIFSLENNKESSINIDSKCGIISFNNVPIGNYDIKIKYTIKSFVINAIYKLTVNSIFNYDNILVSYNENVVVTSYQPQIYPSNGTFTILNVNNGNFSIDRDTGVIIGSNLFVGKYNVNVKYLVNYYNKEIILFANYNLTISPTIFYNVPALTIKYNTSYKINSPNVNPYNGTFSSNNLPKGCILNKNNGSIQIYSNKEKYKILNNYLGYNEEAPDIGSYSININYTVNDVITTSIFYLNII